MAFTTQAKIFLSDLSNYAEIRRGLSPAMRKATPTLKELKASDEGVRQNLINALNDWRASSQAQKIAGSQTAKGAAQALTAAAGSDYYTPSQKVQLLTAGLKLRNMDPEQAEWEIRESLAVTGRLHNQDFYKAKYFLDRESWEPSEATNEMLNAMLFSGGILSYDEETIMKTVREYVKRQIGYSGEDKQKLEEMTQAEKSQITAGFYNDILNIAKSING